MTTNSTIRFSSFLDVCRTFEYFRRISAWELLDFTSVLPVAV